MKRKMAILTDTLEKLLIEEQNLKKKVTMKHSLEQVKFQAKIAASQNAAE